MPKLKQFLENMKEKKTTIMGIIGMVLSLSVMLFPGRFVDVGPDEITEVVGTSWNLIEGIIGAIISVMLIVSRMFPKGE